MALVIDASGSMSQVTFNIVIQFLKLLVDRFDFPNSGTRSVNNCSVGLFFRQLVVLPTILFFSARDNVVILFEGSP